MVQVMNKSIKATRATVSIGGLTVDRHCGEAFLLDVCLMCAYFSFLGKRRDRSYTSTKKEFLLWFNHNLCLLAKINTSHFDCYFLK